MSMLASSLKLYRSTLMYHIIPREEIIRAINAPNWAVRLVFGEVIGGI
jgi:hypothetical protein